LVSGVGVVAASIDQQIAPSIILVDVDVDLIAVARMAMAFIAWTEEHVAAYEQRWLIGTRQRVSSLPAGAKSTEA
jgi:hypothetical protein